MTTTARMALIVRACGLLIGFVAVVPRSARAEELPADVRDALESNAAAMLPLEASLTLQRTSPLSLPDLLTLLEQPRATKLLTPQEFGFAIQGQKLHYREQYKGGKKWELRELAFDTDCFFESLGTTMHITEAEKRIKKSQGARVFGLDYLDAAGIFVPNSPPTIGQPPKSLLLHLLADGGTVEGTSNETVQSMPCLRIDMTHRDRQLRFFLDPGLNYAVRRQEEWSGPQHVSTTVCDRFQKLKPPLQLPMLCRVDFFSYMSHSLPDARQPVVTETMTVTKLDQSPLPESTFVIEPEVGMSVADSRLHPV